MNNNNFVLKGALEKYAETGDDLLINEKVYDEYCRYVQYVSKKFDILPDEPVNEKVSIVNYYLWNKLRLFDKDRASMVTFLTIIIKNSLLMEIRKRNSMKNKINDDSVSFDDTVIIKCGGEREVTRGEFIGKEDDHIISFETQNMFNKVLNTYLETISLKSRDKIRNILLLYFIEDVTQKEIAALYKHQQSYISRIIKAFINYSKRNRERFL